MAGHCEDHLRTGLYRCVQKLLKTPHFLRRAPVGKIPHHEKRVELIISLPGRIMIGLRHPPEKTLRLGIAVRFYVNVAADDKPQDRVKFHSDTSFIKINGKSIAQSRRKKQSSDR